MHQRIAFNQRCLLASLALMMLLAMIASTAVHALPSDEELQRITAQLADQSLGAEQRGELVQRLLTIRRNLLEQHPRDPRRAVWLADQAHDIYFLLLKHDASYLTALFGVLPSGEREPVQQSVAEMHASAQQALSDISNAITGVEAQPGYATSGDLQQQRRDLAEVQRDRRIPFLLGVASVLHGSVNDLNQTQQRTLYQSAERLLTGLQDVLQGDLLLEAQAYAGLARAQLGQFDQAETLFAQVARDSAAVPALVFMARMGGVVNRTRRSGPQAGLEALQSVEARYAADEPHHHFFRVLLADHRFLLMKSLAMQAPESQQSSLLSQAFSAYTNLLRQQTGSQRDALRAVVFSRLVTVAGDDLPRAELPPIVTIARADHLGRNELTRADAIESLEQLLQQADLDGDTHATALFVLGRMLFAHGQRLFAAQRFIELADEFPADYQAQRAIELGVTMAAEEHQQHPGDPQVRDTLRHGLAVLLKRYPNLATIDHWRYVAARLALEEQRFDEALQHLVQITPASPQWIESHLMRVEVERARAEQAGGRAALEQVLATIERVRPVIAAAQSSAADPQRAAVINRHLAMLSVHQAHALVQLQQPQQALEVLNTLDAPGSDDLSIKGELLKVRISALQAMKRPDDALRQVQQFIATAPAEAAAVLLPLLSSLRTDVQALVEAQRQQQSVELAQRTLLPAAQLLEQTIGSAAMEPAAHLHAMLLIADAYRLAGHPDAALARYEQLLSSQPDGAELLLGKAESLFAIGGEQRLADAMTIYKRLAAAGPDAGHDTYWLSQVRMLQILDRVNRNTDQIPLRIERLRQHDRTLGGERYRVMFEALRRKHPAAAPPAPQ